MSFTDYRPTDHCVNVYVNMTIVHGCQMRHLLDTTNKYVYQQNKYNVSDLTEKKSCFFVNNNNTNNNHHIKIILKNLKKNHHLIVPIKSYSYIINHVKITTKSIYHQMFYYVRIVSC